MYVMYKNKLGKQLILSLETYEKYIIIHIMVTYIVYIKLLIHLFMYLYLSNIIFCY